MPPTVSRARSTSTSGTSARSWRRDPSEPDLILTVRGAGLPLPRAVRRLRLHGVGARLSLALLLVVAGALGVGLPDRRPLAREPTDRLATAAGAHLARDLATGCRSTSRAGSRSPSSSRRRRTTRVRHAPTVFENWPLTLAPYGRRGRRRRGSDRAGRRPRRAGGSAKGGHAEGKVIRDGIRFIESADFSDANGIVLVSSSLSDVPTRSTLSSSACCSPVRSRSSPRSSSATAAPGSSRAASGAWSVPPTASPAADSTSRSSTRDRRARPACSGLRPHARAACAARAARREFIANASHELRTPLFSLGGHLELLDRGRARRADPPRVPRAHARAGRAPDEARRGPARPLAARRRPPSRRDAPVDLGASPTSCSTNSSRTPARASTCSRSRRTARPPALGDEQRVLQIGRALVENALRHTPPGTTVRIRRREQRRRAATLAVEDDGPGIPADHASHVFERFYRADGAHGVGERARPGHRPRAGRGDGGRARPRLAARSNGLPVDAADGIVVKIDNEPDGKAARATVGPMRPGVIAAVALVAAVLGGVAVLLIGKAPGRRRPTAEPCSSRRTTREPGPDGSRIEPAREPVAGNGFDPARIYAARSAGVVTVYSFFDARRRRARRTGLRLRRLARGPDPDERARDHDRRRAETSAPKAPTGVRRVQGRRPRRGSDRRLGHLRRRRRPAGRPARAPPDSRFRSATRRGRGRRAGCGHGEPVRQRGLAGRGRRVGEPPVDRGLDLALPRDRRDPDRRSDHPRQLRRPALRRAGPRDRNQRPDPERVGGLREASASRSRSTPRSARCASSSRVAASRTATSA